MCETVFFSYFPANLVLDMDTINYNPDGFNGAFPFLKIKSLGFESFPALLTLLELHEQGHSHKTSHFERMKNKTTGNLDFCLNDFRINCLLS